MGEDPNNHDDDADDTSSGDVKLSLPSNAKVWDIDLGDGVLIQLRNSARDILHLPGNQPNTKEWYIVSTDDDGENLPQERRLFSREDIRNAIFTDTGGETLVRAIVDEQAGRPGPKKKSRKQRKHARKPKTRKPRKHARKSKTHRRRKHKGRHGTTRR